MRPAVVPAQLGSELVVPIVLWLVTPWVLAYWIYQDGAARDEADAAWWALAAGGLGYLTFFGGFLALAVYRWQREPRAEDLL